MSITTKAPTSSGSSRPMSINQRTYIAWLQLKALKLWFDKYNSQDAFVAKRAQLLKVINKRGGGYEERTIKEMFLDLNGFIFDIITDKKFKE